MFVRASFEFGNGFVRRRKAFCRPANIAFVGLHTRGVFVGSRRSVFNKLRGKVRSRRIGVDCLVGNDRLVVPRADHHFSRNPHKVEAARSAAPHPIIFSLENDGFLNFLAIKVADTETVDTETVLQPSRRKIGRSAMLYP